MGIMQSSRAFGERMSMNASAWLRSARGVVDNRTAKAIASDVLTRGGIAPWKSTPTMVGGALLGGAVGAGYSYGTTGRVDPRTALKGMGAGAIGGLGYNMMRGVASSYKSGALGPVAGEARNRMTRMFQSMRTTGGLRPGHAANGGVSSARVI